MHFTLARADCWLFFESATYLHTFGSLQMLFPVWNTHSSTTRDSLDTSSLWALPWSPSPGQINCHIPHAPTTSCIVFYYNLQHRITHRYCCSVPKSCPTLRSHGLQHARLLCPSLFPRVCSNSCPLSQRRHPTISSSATAFSFGPQSFPASGSFPVSWLFASVLELPLQQQSLQWIFRVEFLKDWLVWSPCSPRDSQESFPAPNISPHFTVGLWSLPLNCPMWGKKPVWDVPLGVLQDIGV